MSKCCLLLKLSYSADTLCWKGKILLSIFFVIRQHKNFSHNITKLSSSHNSKNESTKNKFYKKSSKKIGDFESVVKPTKLEYGHIQTSARRTLC